MSLRNRQRRRRGPRRLAWGRARYIPFLVAVVGWFGATTAAASQATSQQAEQLVNTVPYTSESLAQGRKLYLRHCRTCHGPDGRALENFDFEAADLTRPETWRFGSSDGDIFRSTRDGAGEEMPPFRKELEDQEIWALVNYLRSIGPEGARPALVKSAGSPED